jgi:hypothetical protein
MDFLFTHIARLSTFTKVLLTGLLLLLMVLPRFNRNTFLVKRELNDARYFIAYVQYFRGETPQYVIRPASNWRLLVPLVASILPFEPLTAINVINCLAIAVSVWLLFRFLLLLSTNSSVVWLGCWLFVVSFPTFYYTSIGYIDPGVLMFTIACMYFTITLRLWWLLGSFVLGCLTKETIILTIAFTIAFYLKEYPKKALFAGVLMTLLFVLINVLLRKFAYVSPGANNPALWQFSQDALWANISRFNSYAAPILSFGIPGILCIWVFTKTSLQTILTTPILLASCAMMLSGWLLFGLSACATFCDGRIIWQTSFAMIAIVVFFYSKKTAT